MKPLFSSTKHLIYPFTISVKLEGGRIPNVLSCFGAFINVCIDERELWETIAQLAKCRKDLVTHSTPENENKPISS
jgi:hypothetical protein